MKDNIIFITTDQQRFDTLQALGNGSIFTPHLNYLMSEGVTFTRFYADCPLCVPSRLTIMTGKKSYEAEITENVEGMNALHELTLQKKTLPARLTDNGYQTKAMGKMHFFPPRANYGFEHMELSLDYMRMHEKHSETVRPRAHGIGECLAVPVISTVDTKNSITNWTTERSIDFLETRDPLRPFFIWTSFTKPHPPYDPCKDFWDLYDGIDMPKPVYGDWSEDINNAPQGFLKGGYINNDMYIQSPAQVNNIRRAYYACITQIDYSLGMLFGAMRENELFENTWVVFTSDHGDMLGDHHMTQKSMYFEGCSHVPMIIMPPQRAEFRHLRNTICDKHAEMADIYPTLLAMAGIDTTSDGNTGVNLLQDFEGERLFYGVTGSDQFCVMQNKIKLVYSRTGNHYLLFDLNNDPMEQKNLTEDEGYAKIYTELKLQLLCKVKEYNSEVLEGDEFITLPAPKFPGDVNRRWFGFHYKDYITRDTYH